MIPEVVYKRNIRECFRRGCFRHIFSFSDPTNWILNFFAGTLLVFCLLSLVRGLRIFSCGGGNYLLISIPFVMVQLSRAIDIYREKIILWEDGVSCNLHGTRKAWSMRFEFNKIRQIIIDREKNNMFIFGIVNEKEKFLLIKFLDAFRNYEDLISQLKSKLGDKVKIGGEM